MAKQRVIIIGGGIGGLALGLTLHQIGVRCEIYESVRNLKPLGVGINLQPNAVRELYELGIGPEVLDTVGLPVKEWALVQFYRLALEHRGDHLICRPSPAMLEGLISKVSAWYSANQSAREGRIGRYPFVSVRC